MKAYKTEHKLAGANGKFVDLAYDTRDMLRLYRADDTTFLALAPIDVRNLIYDNPNTGLVLDRDIYPNNP